MKKILVMLFGLIVLTGCSKYNQKGIVKDFTKKINNINGYKLSGDLSIKNNDDVYNYDIEVCYKKDDNYKVTLTNKANMHTQIILKNNEGVYVLTPSLNKSFKFQSDWPYNNSQSYLIESIIDDINNDKEKSIVKDDNSIMITSSVNYPNNNKLTKQVVTFDKDYNLRNVSVVDENDIKQMTMTFKTIDLKPTGINKDTFDLNNIIDINETKEEKPTSTLDDIIYPLYIPTGTVLTNSEKVNKSDGERVIMTFEGEKPFLLVEETSSIEQEFSIIPTYGEPYLLIDTVGALTDNSITWSSEGIDYYLVSDVMSQNELLDIARSVNVIPVMK